MTSGNLPPAEHVDGYLPLRDLALIGDGATAALVGRDGSVPWLCLPRFDSPPVFASLLDARRGGSFRIAPERLIGATQRYVQDSAVVVTRLHGEQGVVEVTDALTLQAGADLTEQIPTDRRELVRRVEVLEGPVTVEVAVDLHGRERVEPRGHGLDITLDDRPDLRLHLAADRPLNGLRTRHRLEAGERLDLVLDWRDAPARHQPLTPAERVDNTVTAWRRWIERSTYDGAQAPLVRRSAITLKLLDHFASGAIVAAPTSSLPERIGGVRNWDYRYAWLRDAAMSVHALRTIGFPGEADGFLGWVLDTAETRTYPGVLFAVDGRDVPEEHEDPALEGYRGSAPVRWGNGARGQRQHDSYGEILDCAFQWVAGGGRLDEPLWRDLRALADQAAVCWREPDHGLWEVRGGERTFTYSVGLCHVAVDRAARLAEALSLPGDVDGWRREAGRMQRALLEGARAPGSDALTQHLDGGGLDASVLALPLRRVVPISHPRISATVDAVRRHLGAGRGLVHRYRPEDSPDGLPGDEGAFLLCSFWLVEVLAHLGRLDEAGELFEAVCAHAGPLGLLPEQIDPSTGQFLGNVPQALSHVGVVSAAVALQRAAAAPGASLRPPSLSCRRSTGAPPSQRVS